MISSSRNNDWATLNVNIINSKMKILFTPTVIDDYYVFWGTDNSNHDIPIGFWNSYGYDFGDSDIEEVNNGNVTLEGKKIYKADEEALNGYFMTLADGDSAEWHFALAGPHAIFVHVPFETRAWMNCELRSNTAIG